LLVHAHITTIVQDSQKAGLKRNCQFVPKGFAANMCDARMMLWKYIARLQKTLLMVASQLKTNRIYLDLTYMPAAKVSSIQLAEVFATKGDVGWVR
jgi:hypothetical protein